MVGFSQIETPYSSDFSDQATKEQNVLRNQVRRMTNKDHEWQMYGGLRSETIETVFVTLGLQTLWRHQRYRVRVETQLYRFRN